jgi:hypothetical protein
MLTQAALPADFNAGVHNGLGPWVWQLEVGQADLSQRVDMWAVCVYVWSFLLGRWGLGSRATGDSLSPEKVNTKDSVSLPCLQVC